MSELIFRISYCAWSIDMLSVTEETQTLLRFTFYKLRRAHREQLNWKAALASNSINCKPYKKEIFKEELNRRVSWDLFYLSTQKYCKTRGQIKNWANLCLTKSLSNKVHYNEDFNPIVIYNLLFTQERALSKVSPLLTSSITRIIYVYNKTRLEWQVMLFHRYVGSHIPSLFWMLHLSTKFVTPVVLVL